MPVYADDVVDCPEFILETDGTVSGPDVSKAGRPVITHALFVEDNLPHHELVTLFNTYYEAACKAICQRTKTTKSPNMAWNVTVQSTLFMNENDLGTLYCIIAEIDHELGG